MKYPFCYILMIIILLFPNSILVQANIATEDPFSKDQWPLEKIGFHSSGLSQLTVDNLVLGKTITTGNSSFLFEGKPFSSENFNILLGQTKMRRLSIEMESPPQGRWTAEVKDENGKRISQNTTTQKRIDLLLPKDSETSDLTISINSTNGAWSEPPIIQKLTGVQSTIIAVIDSGVVEHEDFCDNILYSLGVDFREGMDLPIDTNGHGTHVTGIIAACNQNGIGISGAIGGASIDVIPLKVLSSNGLTDDAALTAALQQAIDYDVDVVNLSIAGKGITERFEGKIRETLLNDIPIVAAAGNGNELTENVYPANLPGVITVASVNKLGNKVNRSNYGWEVDISAPGFEILSTYTSPSYQKVSGTSMAAPYVSSVVANYKRMNPSLDFIQIRRLLEKNALDLGEKGYDIYTGAGLVQFSNSITATENIDWLNLKQGQPIEKKTNIILGFSESLIGKSVLVFKDERILNRMAINEMMENLPLDDVRFSLHDNEMIAIVVDEKNRVIDSSRILVTNSTIPNHSSEFKDILNTHWAYKEILLATNTDLVNGYPDGSFRPSESISRRQSLMMLNRILGKELPRLLTVPFKDVSWSTPGVLAVLSGAENGYIKGMNGSFYPENKLTRGQMALILARVLKLDSKGNVKTPYSFSDVPLEAEYYQAVQALTEKGIITRQANFRPTEPITRAQFTAMLIRTQQAMEQK